MKCMKFAYGVFRSLFLKIFEEMFIFLFDFLLNLGLELSESDGFDYLRRLKPFDRAVLKYGLLLKAISGSGSRASLKVPEKDVSVKILDLLHDFKAVNDWERGLSSEQIARVLKYSVRQVQNGLRKLLFQGKVKKLTRGREARYILGD